MKISKKDKARIYNDVGAGFQPSKSRTSEMLFRLGELAAAFFLEKQGVNAFRLSKLADISRGKEMKKEYKRKLEALRRLKKLKLVTIEKQGDQLMVSLTSKGWTSFLSNIRYRGAKKLPGAELCFVSFDIPEDIRDIRRIVRAELKKAEFKLIHHSLWASKLDVADALVEVIRQANADHWVSIFIGRKIV